MAANVFGITESFFGTVVNLLSTWTISLVFQLLDISLMVKYPGSFQCCYLFHTINDIDQTVRKDDKLSLFLSIII